MKLRVICTVERIGLTLANLRCDVSHSGSAPVLLCSVVISYRCRSAARVLRESEVLVDTVGGNTPLRSVGQQAGRRRGAELAWQRPDDDRRGGAVSWLTTMPARWCHRNAPCSIGRPSCWRRGRRARCCVVPRAAVPARRRGQPRCRPAQQAPHTLSGLPAGAAGIPPLIPGAPHHGPPSGWLAPIRPGPHGSCAGWLPVYRLCRMQSDADKPPSVPSFLGIAPAKTWKPFPLRADTQITEWNSGKRIASGTHCKAWKGPAAGVKVPSKL